MSPADIILYLFVVAAAITALALIFTRNVFYGALLVVACLLSLAGVYVLMYAEFVAVTQIMVYAGGILVVMLFGVMLTARLGEEPMAVTNTNRFSSTLLFLAMLSVISFAIYGATNGPDASLFKESATAQAAIPTGVREGKLVENTGVLLMTEYALPFELAGILLLVSLIGAALIAADKSTP